MLVLGYNGRKSFSLLAPYMDKMQESRKLYDLQLIDLKVSAIEKSLQEVRYKLADNSAIDDVVNILQSFKSQLDSMNTKRHVVEGAIGDFQERLKKIESRLYGGAITNPRELSAAEEERGFIADEQRLSEDTLLELMVNIEDTLSCEAEAKEELHRVKAERIEDTVEFQEMEGSLDKELSELLDDRKQVVPLLSVQTLALYDSIRKRRAGLAVAKVERGMCQGCRLNLSTMELQRVRGSDDIVQCGSCTRILYVA